MQDKLSKELTDLICKAAEKAHAEIDHIAAPEIQSRINWPLECTVGPGLEGAIACETKIGFVNGSKGELIYRGYNIFDLCAHSTYEETCYLLIYGQLPTAQQLDTFNRKLVEYRNIPNTLRLMMSFPLEEMNPMAALRMGTNFMRQRLTWRDQESAQHKPGTSIASDEDSIPMETPPIGERDAIYAFPHRRQARPVDARKITDDAASIETCLHLIAGVSTLVAAIKRLREDKLPIQPDPELSHAANLLYMMNGKRPTPEETRVMDVCLILHADHGMNASTFASMVVASTLSDVYFSVGSGIAALNGPLHGGANEEVVKQLMAIGSVDKVDAWYDEIRQKGDKVMGFGHRVYKCYDPRARILGPLAEHLVEAHPESQKLFAIARRIEERVMADLGGKGIFPNVDFYSGLVYSCLQIPPSMFTPIFAASRVAGWVARVHEYLKKNRIFRPRAMYTGPLNVPYQPIDKRE